MPGLYRKPSPLPPFLATVMTMSTNNPAAVVQVNDNLKTREMSRATAQCYVFFVTRTYVAFVTYDECVVVVQERQRVQR